MKLTKEDIYFIDQLRKEAKENKTVYLLLNTIWAGVIIDDIGNADVNEDEDIRHDLRVAQLAWQFVLAEIQGDGQGENDA